MRQRSWARRLGAALLKALLGLAAVSAEDQRFPRHGGFNLVELKKAWWKL